MYNITYNKNKIYNIYPSSNLKVNYNSLGINYIKLEINPNNNILLYISENNNIFLKIIIKKLYINFFFNNQLIYIINKNINIKTINKIFFIEIYKNKIILLNNIYYVKSINNINLLNYDGLYKIKLIC